GPGRSPRGAALRRSGVSWGSPWVATPERRKLRAPRESPIWAGNVRRRHANTGNIYCVPTPSTPPSRHPLAWMPLAVVALGAVASAVHGPIAQPADYHAFADRRA